MPNFVESGLRPGALGCDRGTLQRFVWLVTLPCSALVSSPLVVQTLSNFLRLFVSNKVCGVCARTWNVFRRLALLPVVLARVVSSQTISLELHVLLLPLLVVSRVPDVGWCVEFPSV